MCWCWCCVLVCALLGTVMASGGHSLALPSYNSGDEVNSSPLAAVWTAQVPLASSAMTGNSNPNGSGPSDLCWQMVESGQQAVQLRRRRHSQRLFHLGRTLLLKHLPRDVTEHVSSNVLHLFFSILFWPWFSSIFFSHTHKL